MITYQLDEFFLFFCVNPDYKDKPNLAVLTAPPEIPDGKVAKWKTELCPIKDVTFGDAGTGQWIILSDNRGKTLYNTIDGSNYSGDYIGIGDLPNGVTDIVPPSPLHEWNGTEWSISSEVESEQEEKRAITLIEARIADGVAKYNFAVQPLQYAVDLEMATPEEETLLAEWKKYRVLLNRVKSQEGYPFDVEFPAEPV
ncbi:tail fiber assembly protein [Pelistega sp. MC2]|uniref:tail fiber assembly protein n=1 Tax=Pelistega sp. MC2 TaxID=1720297 RepID=UPI0008DA649F|nr:tail fiber assembly protein [Pelistega sp. MC2]